MSLVKEKRGCYTLRTYRYGLTLKLRIHLTKVGPNKSERVWANARCRVFTAAVRAFPLSTHVTNVHRSLNSTIKHGMHTTAYLPSEYAKPGYTYANKTVHKPNVLMCGRCYEPVLHRSQMVRILFAAH